MTFLIFLHTGEPTLTEALTATGRTYEEIAEIVASQVTVKSKVFSCLKSGICSMTMSKIHT